MAIQRRTDNASQGEQDANNARNNARLRTLIPQIDSGYTPTPDEQKLLFDYGYKVVDGHVQKMSFWEINRSAILAPLAVAGAGVAGGFGLFGGAGGGSAAGSSLLGEGGTEAGVSSAGMTPGLIGGAAGATGAGTAATTAAATAPAAATIGKKVGDVAKDGLHWKDDLLDFGLDTAGGLLKGLSLQKRQSFAGGPNDPNDLLSQAGGHLDAFGSALQHQGVPDLSSLTVQHPPTFTGGGLPMPIGVSGQDQSAGVTRRTNAPTAQPPNGGDLESLKASLRILGGRF